MSAMNTKRFWIAVISVLAGCGSAMAPAETPESVSATIEVTASFDDLPYPTLRMNIFVTGTSSRGLPVTLSALAVDGAPATSPALVSEGSHVVCATVRSTSLAAASTCRTENLMWPRFQGRVTQLGANGAVLLTNPSLAVDDVDQHPVFTADGTFAFPSARAASGTPKLWFADAAASLPSLVRPRPREFVNVILLPRRITIPECSVYAGQVVPIDLDAAFRWIPGSQSAFFDRASTVNGARVVVASWNLASIPIAFSDTGAVVKRISTADSAEIMTALATLTAYTCQKFHLATVAQAAAGGVVIHKDPAFAALGAHSMALPAQRGDYVRADVVVRTLVPTHTAVRDSTRRTVMHEFMHVLGFGHTCSWPSVMTTGTVCDDSLRAMVPSREDVAHYLAMQYARRAERESGSVLSVGAAYAADLVARGQSERLITSFYSIP